MSSSKRSELPRPALDSAAVSRIATSPTSASDTVIKNAYKAFARKNHPDRVGAAGGPLFIQVRDAYEALKHPIKRYGYDRFGFDALEWKVAENPHAMLHQGLENAMYYYVPTGAIMLTLAIFGWGGHSAYWRSVTWALVATLETCLIIGYNPFSAYSNPFAPLVNLLAPLSGRLASWFLPEAPLFLIPSMAPYQWVFFLRQLFVTSAIALGQVLPVLFPPPPTAKEEQAREAEIAKLAIALDPVVRQIIIHSHISDQEAKETLLKEMQYLHPSVPAPLPTTIQLTDEHRQALVDLKPTMQRLFVQNVLLKDPELSPSYISAVERARMRPHGHEHGIASIGQGQPMPAPAEVDMAGRFLAIPSPPSSAFSLSREPTPEYPGTGFEPSPSEQNNLHTAPPFDVSTPGFNYQPSPSRTTGFTVPSPSIKRRPSMSPSKRSSISLHVGAGRSVSEGLPFSPTSPVMNIKQELA
ncbi:hypothetical protein FRC06_004952 [Ceratobasidium sp. 370]|nr:hypothetical protein FRC06_004952 [Ceratobasidium sp. 370]